jgi:uncharacterized protein (UPF0218 family)
MRDFDIILHTILQDCSVKAVGDLSGSLLLSLLLIVTIAVLEERMHKRGQVVDRRLGW